MALPTLRSAIGNPQNLQAIVRACTVIATLILSPLVACGEGLPADIRKFSALKPKYKSLPGWKDDISKVRKAGDLPATARAYLRFLEEFVGVPIGIISVGPEREASFKTKGAPKG